MKKGFTLVELLAVILVLSILLIIAIPTYINVSDSIKSSNLENIKQMVANSMLNYANKELIDDIKPANTNCSDDSCCIYYSINYIKNNNIFQTTNGTIINPITNQDLSGYIKTSYNTDNYEIVAEYKADLNGFGNCHVVEE